ncbi:alpha/beta hydrolase [Kribbella pittospori]|uniref:Alpha/beta hydrolase n=1 Tax=Kribbella pittospori TaxID=722689 RepID=A0A4R0KPS3_9ACTN|nr:alpha/beta hydrolase [Kribbella pittospori]TCC61374.1 alpha/beta hydrolase [Kribbella pittospori]
MNTTDFRHRTVGVGGSALHLVEAGSPGDPPVVFLHGWPQSSWAWRHILPLAADDGMHAIAVDLPGIGESTGDATNGSKVALARVIHGLIDELRLNDPVLVGHDVGGMATYAYLCTYDGLRAAVVMDVAVPGVDPWDRVVANPQIWHFAFHQTPDLPELLVSGNRAAYFDFFYEILTADSSAITSDDRVTYARAYCTDGALTAGFNWYRTFPQDAEQLTTPGGTPLLYLRGDHEYGELDDYAEGFHRAGVTSLTTDLIPGAGHFAPEEAPEASWTCIARHLK